MASGAAVHRQNQRATARHNGSMAHEPEFIGTRQVAGGKRWMAWLPAMLAASALLTLCHAPGSGVEVTSPSGFVGDPESLLPGTWLRESRTEGVSTRHLLVLGADHRFREVVRVVDPSGRSADYMHEGTWLYDGTNLKRKYTSINGQPPSRLNLPFATFQITFDSPRQFSGIDHIHGNRVEYRRVAADTEL